MSETINWSHHDLDGLEELYWDEIAPALRRDGRDPHTPPSYETLADLGYSGISYTLRQHHDLTVKEFLTDVVGLDDPTVSSKSPGDYAWQISSTETIDEFEDYLRALDRRRKLVDSTLASKRTHLATYAQIYEDLHGTSGLLTPVSDPSEQATETERAYQVGRSLTTNLQPTARNSRTSGRSRAGTTDLTGTARPLTIPWTA